MHTWNPSYQQIITPHLEARAAGQSSAKLGLGAATEAVAEILNAVLPEGTAPSSLLPFAMRAWLTW
jgi:hypothetical protein